MTETYTRQDLGLPPPFPDHTQLPDEDGTFVTNFQEHPQSIILTDSITPVLERLHPDGQYCIGQDSGIYWRETDPPEKGAESPDWFYVPNVPPNLDGAIRRSYVFWRELQAPVIALEFASGDGSEERDRTPLSRIAGITQRPGKFWVYGQIIRIPYYGIYEITSGKLEVYHLIDFTYHKLEPNGVWSKVVDSSWRQWGISARTKGSQREIFRNHQRVLTTPNPTSGVITQFP